MVDNKIVEPALLRISLALLLIRTHLAGNHWKEFKSFATRQSLNQGCEFPFNSTIKYQLSIHESQDHKDNYLLVMKGMAYDRST